MCLKSKIVIRLNKKFQSESILEWVITQQVAVKNQNIIEFWVILIGSPRRIGRRRLIVLTQS